MSNVVHSPTDTLMSSTKTEMVTTVLSRRLLAVKIVLDSSSLQALIFQSLQFSVLSTVTPRQTQKHFAYGKLNLVTSLTVPRS